MFVVFIVSALLFAACGGDDDDSSSSTGKSTTPSSGAAASGDLGTGVTNDTIKLGIAIVDYDAIKDFVDFTRGDQQKTAQVFVDYINKNGGVRRAQDRSRLQEVPAHPGTGTERARRSAPRGPRTTRCSRCSVCSSTSAVTRSCA